jgi:hypothetical protein
MSLGNAAETSTLQLFFQNTAFANIGNAGGLQPSTVAGNYWIALHTGAGPGAGGNQSTNEAAYPGYTREPVARSVAGWTITGNQPATAENAAAITFPTATGGPETETFTSVGVASAGATEFLWFGALTLSLIVNTGITPSYAINALQCLLS